MDVFPQEPALSDTASDPETVEENVMVKKPRTTGRVSFPGMVQTRLEITKNIRLSRG